jgi:hypothetical protein
VFSADVGAAILNLLENDHLSDGPRKTSRLQSLLGDDKTAADRPGGHHGRQRGPQFLPPPARLPGLRGSGKKSLMARIIKARPETGELVSGSNAKRRRSSARFMGKPRKEKGELDELIRVRIPQNTQGYLDRPLLRRPARELRIQVRQGPAEIPRPPQATSSSAKSTRARGTDFKGSDAAKVNIGTIVTLDRRIRQRKSK